MVTVTEVDLPRNRIALSMRSKPELGPKSPLGGPGTARGPGGGQRSNSAPPAPRVPPPVNNDWFSAALNKKR
jgi:uncharacterized protein